MLVYVDKHEAEGELFFGLEGFLVPFTWVMLPGGSQFQGVYQDAAFSVGAWCGGRYGEEPPFEACMPAE
ncbi:MAG: hypothetical protein JXA97_04585 [Anaerolineales bacterium]|nr:hypothetical protein [Anaerolineales bacterium]